MLFTTGKNKKHKNINHVPSHEYKDKVENNSPGLLGAGIVLVKSRDPCSLLFSTITKQEYSLIGTYEIHKNTDEIKISIFNIFNWEKPIWDRNVSYLSELVDYDFIIKIILIPLITLDLLGIIQENLKEMHYDNNDYIARRLMDLFGSDVLAFPLLKCISELLETSTNSLTNPIETMIHNSNYIDSNNVNTIKTNGYVSRNFHSDIYYLKHVYNTFIAMFINDKRFYKLVTGYFSTVHPYDELVENLNSYMSLHEDIIQMINSWIQDKTIDKDCLLDILQNINKNNMTSIYDHSNIKNNIPDEIIVIDKTPTEEISSIVKNLKEELDKISSTIMNGNVPVIRLNDMIKSVNNLTEYYDIGDKVDMIDKPVSGLISISPNGDTIVPMTLKSGNEIIITTEHFNLSLFTTNELIEILENIEAVMIDNRYDNVRNNITREILSRNDM